MVHCSLLALFLRSLLLVHTFLLQLDASATTGVIEFIPPVRSLVQVCDSFRPRWRGAVHVQPGTVHHAGLKAQSTIKQALRLQLAVEKENDLGNEHGPSTASTQAFLSLEKTKESVQCSAAMR